MEEKYVMLIVLDQKGVIYNQNPQSVLESAGI